MEKSPYRVYPLENELVTYVYSGGVLLSVNPPAKERKIQAIRPARKQGEDPCRNEIGENKIERGAKGERFVLDLLISKYGRDCAWKVPENERYDLYCEYADEVERIEVKTLNSVRSEFYMTINELEAATTYEGEYYLYLVIWDYEENAQPEIIKFQNPMLLFQIEVNLLKTFTGSNVMNPNQTGIRKLEINSVAISLGEEILNNIQRYKYE